MKFEEFKRRYEENLSAFAINGHGINISDEELIKLFVSQLVIGDFQKEQHDRDKEQYERSKIASVDFQNVTGELLKHLQSPNSANNNAVSITAGTIQSKDLVLEKVGGENATTRTINADGFRIEPNGLKVEGSVIHQHICSDEKFPTT